MEAQQQEWMRLASQDSPDRLFQYLEQVLYDAARPLFVKASQSVPGRAELEATRSSLLKQRRELRASLEGVASDILEAVTEEIRQVTRTLRGMAKQAFKQRRDEHLEHLRDSWGSRNLHKAFFHARMAAGVRVGPKKRKHLE
eukprot:6006211-Pyramimonas_sp.AAC.1